ncbi:unnamed protein product [Symbiodinium natans]|uniref:Uncharacterized protein n=1 Tax=Symbiodinium natans TaxID=878477 RepID=A0A812QRI2_9DINO|nr:unnamed protein product [Symbiodinium natans]
MLARLSSGNLDLTLRMRALDVRAVRERLERNAAQGFPLDMELLQTADDLVVRFQAHPPEGFFNYICGLQEFCLFGYVSALFVRARHLMLEPGERETANDLSYAEPILGKEKLGQGEKLGLTTPVTEICARRNINQTDFMTYAPWCHEAQYVSKNPVRPPSVPLESLHWQPPLDLVARLSQPRAKALVQVAVFGTHATLSLEPVDMLKRSQAHFELKATFFGLEPRWCEILGLCDQGSSAITQLLRAAEEDPFAYPWDTLSQHLSAAASADPALREAQLLLCTEPVAGCIMLRQWASRERGSLPMLGFYGVALLNGCPPQDVKTFWRGFGELLDSSSKTRMATNNLILSEQPLPLQL